MKKWKKKGNHSRFFYRGKGRGSKSRVPALQTGKDAALLAGVLDAEFSDLVDGFAFLLENGADGVLAALLDDDHHADTAVEGTGHLGRRDIAGLLEPLEDGWQLPRGDVDVSRQGGRQHAGDVLDETTTGDVGETLDGGRGCGGVGGWGREGLQQGLNVDAGWGEEGSSNRERRGG